MDLLNAISLKYGSRKAHKGYKGELGYRSDVSLLTEYFYRESVWRSKN
jgi:hypothetical protein